MPGRTPCRASPRAEASRVNIAWHYCCSSRLTSSSTPRRSTMDSLTNVRIAILCTDGFEQSELREPRAALDAAGAVTSVVSPKGEQVHGWHHGKWGSEVRVDVALDRAQAQDFDALLLPGGVMNPDSLRIHPKAVEFVKAFFDADKQVAAICHGPWMVIETSVARGRRI